MIFSTDIRTFRPPGCTTQSNSLGALYETDGMRGRSAASSGGVETEASVGTRGVRMTFHPVVELLHRERKKWHAL